MKTSKSVYIYTSVYTAALLLVGVLTVQGYVFAPRIPYFYVLIVPLFILQGRLFRANSQDKNMKRLFILNLLSNALLFTVKPIIGLQYFMVFHFIMIVFCAPRYWRCWKVGVFFSTINIAHIILQIKKEAMELGFILMLLIGSTALSLFLLYEPYPRVHIRDDIVKFGTEFDMNDFYLATDVIDVGIGQFAQLGKFYKG